MAHRMAWIDVEGEQFKILHLNIGGGWHPYTHPSFNLYRVADLEPVMGVKHSKGWRTMQRCLKLGFSFVDSTQALEEKLGVKDGVRH